MPLGLAVEEEVEIVVGKVQIQPHELLAHHLGSKVVDKTVTLADRQPQQYGLLPAVAVTQQLQLSGRKGLEALGGLAGQAFSRARRADLQRVIDECGRASRGPVPDLGI